MLYTMQLHYSPRYITVRKAIDDGKIGKVRQLLFVESRGDWNHGDVWQYDDPKQGKVNWRRQPRGIGRDAERKGLPLLRHLELDGRRVA